MNAVGRMIHADWSIHPRKRWAAFATRSDDGSLAVDDISRFSMSAEQLRTESGNGGILIGFDFPIGLPRAYAASLGIARFPEFLRLLTSDPHFADFARPAVTADEVSRYRPFYPARPGGTSRLQLVQAHGVASFDVLLRECERRTATRMAACSVFWTLGGNQVGRAASAGWVELLAPLSSDAAIGFWPFDGTLGQLTATKQITVAETYPAEAMRFLQISDGRKFSKRRQSDRMKVQDRIQAAAQSLGVTFDEDVERLIADGFGCDTEGEDRFDALVGLLGMAAVLTGNRAEGSASQSELQDVEGWILGQSASEKRAHS